MPSTTLPRRGTRGQEAIAIPQTSPTTSERRCPWIRPKIFTGVIPAAPAIPCPYGPRIEQRQCQSGRASPTCRPNHGRFNTNSSRRYRSFRHFRTGTTPLGGYSSQCSRPETASTLTTPVSLQTSLHTIAKSTKTLEPVLVPLSLW